MSSLCPSAAHACFVGISVSYTLLDVYKRQVSALSQQLDKNAQQVEATDDTRAELLSDTYSRLKSEREAREAEAARIAAEKKKAEEEAKRKAEAARIAAETKKACLLYTSYSPWEL